MPICVGGLSNHIQGILRCGSSYGAVLRAAIALTGPAHVLNRLSQESSCHSRP